MEYFYLYILRCKDNSYYIGHTDNLDKRIAEHKAKKYAGYTASRLPIELVYAETFSMRTEAMEAEYKIKKWSRNKKEALIKLNWDKIKELAKKKF